MADLGEQDVQKLFRRWRKGDAQASMAMAQRFSDWYYAITAVRLGDKAGRAPLQAACSRFESGIVAVGQSSELIDWAHSLVAEEIDKAGGRTDGGDFPNALTRGRSPSELVAQARPHLDEEHVRLLHLAYGHAASLPELTQAAEEQGGFPMALLAARYALKAALRNHCDVPFSVVPSEPDLDLAPLPLYEAARMEAPEDEADFEMWLISNTDLCKDVAEFATFSHALRAGVYGLAAPKRAPKQRTPNPRRTAEDSQPIKERSSMGLSPVLIGLALLALFAFAVVLVGLLLFFLGS